MKLLLKSLSNYSSSTVVLFLMFILLTVKFIELKASSNNKQDELMRIIKNETWINLTSQWMDDCRLEFDNRLNNQFKLRLNVAQQDCCFKIFQNYCFERKCHAETDERCNLYLAPITNSKCYPFIENPMQCLIDGLKTINNYGLRMVLYSKCYLKMEAYFQLLSKANDKIASINNNETLCCRKTMLKDCYNTEQKVKCLNIQFKQQVTLKKHNIFCDYDSAFQWIEENGDLNCFNTLQCGHMLLPIFNRFDFIVTFIVYIFLVLLLSFSFYLFCFSKRKSYDEMSSKTQ